MIVIDTSALIAILLREPEADRFEDVIFQSSTASIGAPTVFEYLMVSEGKRAVLAAPTARQILDNGKFNIVPWIPELAALAHEAFLTFGKGRHPARLNFGDCMSYALAKSLDAPLLYKGDDFARTDIVSAI